MEEQITQEALMQVANQTQPTINVVKEITIASASMDQFYTISTYAVAILGFLLAVVLFYIIMILRDATYVSRKARETSDTLNEYVRRPAGVLMKFFSTFEGVGEVMVGQITNLLSKKSKSKRKRSYEEDED